MDTPTLIWLKIFITDVQKLDIHTMREQAGHLYFLIDREHLQPQVKGYLISLSLTKTQADRQLT